jgi:undecaprenyl diphosphate synthase
MHIAKVTFDCYFVTTNYTKTMSDTNQQIPVLDCVGFIMDGNRRWAKERGLPTMEGHKQGEDTFYNCARWIKEMGIPHGVFYAFSTENWLRDKAEVDYLMELFVSFIKKMKAEIHTDKVRIKVIGERTKFSQELQDLIKEAEEMSAEYTDTTIWVALSYGGRAEILRACNQAITAGVPVDEATFAALLYTAGMPDPDLIIRTGGDLRTSNFLPWQAVYSELFFTDTYWPAFTKDEFTRIVAQYGERQRRRGK